MTKNERTASSIAKQFADAVSRLEAFNDDPQMVIDEVAHEARHSDQKSRVTLMAVHAALSASDKTALELLRRAPSHPFCPDVNGTGEPCDWCKDVAEVLR